MHTGFHGHDSIIGIAIESDALPAPITSRVLGALALRPGAAVRINIRGPVNAWPQGARPRDAADPVVAQPG